MKPKGIHWVVYKQPLAEHDRLANAILGADPRWLKGLKHRWKDVGEGVPGRFWGQLWGQPQPYYVRNAFCYSLLYCLFGRRRPKLPLKHCPSTTRSPPLPAGFFFLHQAVTPILGTPPPHPPRGWSEGVWPVLGAELGCR